MSNIEKSSDILVLVLANGDTIIGEVTESGGAYLVVSPLQILTQPDEETGQVRMGIVDYLPFCNTEAGIAIPTSTAVVAIPGEELITHYNTRFSKIITPPTPKIILG